MKVFLKVVFVFGIMGVLTGCFSQSYNGSNIKLRAGDFKNNYNASAIGERLAKYNVRFFQEERRLSLLLPNKDFFVKNSANFTGNAYTALDLIFGLISYYQDPTVVVNGYFKDARNVVFTKALAAERARRIMKYLWKSGVYSNYIYTDVYPVCSGASNSFLGGNTLIIIDF
jgi:outer membrane protein OmpA-like peptidoglycan-associated protein